jgi:hypothetical protein
MIINLITIKIKKQILIALSMIIITLSSCKVKPSHEPENNIMGEWKFVRIVDNRKLKLGDELIPERSYKRLPMGYIFNEDKTCENKVGYFKRTKGNEPWTYLGNKTKYELANDTLQIFNLATNIWDIQKIFSITTDTLTFQLIDSVYTKFAKVSYKINQKESYDKIIFSWFGGWGGEEIISIDNSGKVIYFERPYWDGGASRDGYYTSTITKEAYTEIENNFKKADIKNLRSRYSSEGTDQGGLAITFFKNGRILKTVRGDNGLQEPAELIWAYTQLKYLHQQLKLIPLKNTNYFSSLGCKILIDNEERCRFSKSEQFLLSTILFEGKETTRKVENKRYTIEYYIFNDGREKTIESVYTDGRYYQFRDKTIDIGFYFQIEESYKFLMEDEIKWMEIEKKEDSITFSKLKLI